jgi:hypothetical protein
MKNMVQIIKNIFLSLFFLSNCFGIYSQTTVTVNDGGSYTYPYAPFHYYSNYTYSQTIYRQSEIDQSGAITSVEWEFYHANSTGAESAIKVYMGHTSKNDFTSYTDWIAVGNMTLVYDGNITGGASSGWRSITLDTPFSYNNSDNLVIAVDENTNDYSNGKWRYSETSSGDDRLIVYYSDGTNPDPASPPLCEYL